MSFRQMLLAGFLLIALVLGAAAMQGLHLLEAFAQQSRHGADAALGLTSAAQQLAERTVDMERSARQYRVLGDDALKARFVVSRDKVQKKPEVIAGFRAQYGPAAISVPQDAGIDRALWAVPVTLFVMAAVGIVVIGRRWRQREGDRPERAETSEKDESAKDYDALLEEELRRMEGDQ